MVSLDGILYNEGNYEKIQKKIGYLPQEIDLYPNLTVKECLVYMGGLSGVSRNDLKQKNYLLFGKDFSYRASE